jgi:hypothetical protein
VRLPPAEGAGEWGGGARAMETGAVNLPYCEATLISGSGGRLCRGPGGRGYARVERASSLPRVRREIPTRWTRSGLRGALVQLQGATTVPSGRDGGLGESYGKAVCTPVMTCGAAGLPPARGVGGWSRPSLPTGAGVVWAGPREGGWRGWQTATRTTDGRCSSSAAPGQSVSQSVSQSVLIGYVPWVRDG